MSIPQLKYNYDPSHSVPVSSQLLTVKPEMSYPTIEQLESLKSALLNGLPFCNGTIRLSPEDYLLFFAKGDDGQ